MLEQPPLGACETRAGMACWPGTAAGAETQETNPQRQHETQADGCRRPGEGAPIGLQGLLLKQRGLQKTASIGTLSECSKSCIYGAGARVRRLREG